MIKYKHLYAMYILKLCVSNLPFHLLHFMANLSYSNLRVRMEDRRE